MNERPYDSLRENLVLPFVLLGFVVSALLSLITFALVAELEERAIQRTLQVEIESFQHRLSIHPDALPAASSLLQGHFLPSADFPQIAKAKPGGAYYEFLTLDDADYSVLAAEVAGQPFALLYDRSYVKANLAKLALALLIGTAIMTFLSFLIGYRLAGQVVRPIVRLLAEVSEKIRQFHPEANSMRFSTAEYPKNEIGRLVQAMDHFALRLWGALQRERFFAADVSHELRTPIAVIRGAAEVMAEIPALPDIVRQRLLAIQRHAIRMADILEAMLLLSREESAGDDPSCAVAEVIRDVVADCEPLLLDLPVAIVTQFDAYPIVAVERSLVYVVISNLLRNACAHTQRGEIVIYLDETGVEIVDSGTGIPADRFPELFERYVKGEESTGYGLGLSIVARVTDKIGWRVAFDSEARRGARVRLTFGAQADWIQPPPSSGA